MLKKNMKHHFLNFLKVTRKLTFIKDYMRSIFILGIMLMVMLATVYPNHKDISGSQRQLSFGQIGSDVRLLQSKLNEKGYRIGAVDGIYGFTTRAKVKEYQDKNNLKVTGVVDLKTFDSLDQPVLNRKQPRINLRVKLSEEDKMLLARTVNGEARGESFEGQVAVASVIINRMESPQFPKTVPGVVFQAGAFDAVEDGQIWLEPTRSTVRAVEVALESPDNTGGALYYFNPVKSTNRWIWSRPQIKKIGEHIFAR